jgi:hypothetical protein
MKFYSVTCIVFLQDEVLFCYLLFLHDKVYSVTFIVFFRIKFLDFILHEDWYKDLDEDMEKTMGQA